LTEEDNLQGDALPNLGKNKLPLDGGNVSISSKKGLF